MLFDLFVCAGSKNLFYGTMSLDSCLSIISQNRSLAENLFYGFMILPHKKNIKSAD